MSKSGAVVFVSGNFNVLHPGHLRLLKFAKECGSRLVVGVCSDRIAGAGAHVPEQLRLENIQSCSLVDKVFLMDRPAAEFIKRIRPDIVVKGKEHEGSVNEEESVLAGYGGRLIFSSGETIYSSHDLLQKEFSRTPELISPLPQDYLYRHGANIRGLIDIVKSFSNLKILVVGDLIVDEYITCDPLGMSQEDPTIVVTPVNSTQFVGGAGVVAAHAAGLGADVSLVTVSGDDPAHYFAKLSLGQFGVRASLIVDRNRPTTLKQRYRSKGKTLLRVSHLHQSSINVELQGKLISMVKRFIKDCDLVVFSDFNYGCLPGTVVDQIIDLGLKRKVTLVADSQSSSQIGDICRFHSMDLITPTEREARISTRDQESGLVVLAEKVRQQAGARNVLLKMGEDGVLVHSGEPQKPFAVTDRISALNAMPRDVAGAGDSMLIASAMSIASGADVWSAAAIGSLAAALQVGRVGNTPLQQGELLEEIK